MQLTQGYPKLGLKFWWVEMRALQRAITKTPFTFWPKLVPNMGVIIVETIFTMKLTLPGTRTAQTLFAGVFHDL